MVWNEIDALREEEDEGMLPKVEVKVSKSKVTLLFEISPTNDEKVLVNVTEKSVEVAVGSSYYRRIFLPVQVEKSSRVCYAKDSVVIVLSRKKVSKI